MRRSGNPANGSTRCSSAVARKSTILLFSDDRFDRASSRLALRCTGYTIKPSLLFNWSYNGTRMKIKKVGTTAFLTPYQRRALAQLQAKRGDSMGHLIREAVTMLLAKYEAKQK